MKEILVPLALLIAVLAVVAVVWLLCAWAEQVAASRFASEAIVLEAVEDNRCAEYKRSGSWPAEPTPVRRWRVGDLLARLRVRNARILDQRAADSERRAGR